jgi:hypothetical protein
MPDFDLTKEDLVMACDTAAFGMLKRLAEKQRREVRVLSASAMTVPAIFAAAGDPDCLTVIRIDAETPEGRFILLLNTVVAVRGYCLDLVRRAT